MRLKTSSVVISLAFNLIIIKNSSHKLTGFENRKTFASGQIFETDSWVISHHDLLFSSQIAWKKNLVHIYDPVFSFS
jgi:hypothetical protein